MTREEAIQILSTRDWSGMLCGYTSGYTEALDMSIEALSERTGQWIDVNGDGSLWKCDQCNDTACCMGNYCPTCGARMFKEDGDAE